MKQTKRAVSGIFTLLLITVLFVQCKDQATKEAGEATVASERDAEYLPLAYVDVDSLLAHFDLYNRLVSNFEDKASKHNSKLNADYQKLQNEVINFQQKAQNNAFLTQDRALQEQNRIQRIKDDLDKQAAQVEQDMALDSRLLQQQMTDSLVLGMKEFNNPQKYHMIFAKSGNSILYADAHYNITQEVIEFLNKRFKAE
ncbi:MAG: OmpH family outer membrane protein [Dysgonamonadaceae bacterium]|jgi:outer membrane protein|nr:OmpH family outer membrane protein [Dysgonamonadaceae bacterium]